MSGSEEMELGADADITSILDMRKLKETKIHDDEAKGLGCWMNWRFIGRCLSLKSKEGGFGNSPQDSIIPSCFTILVRVCISF